MNFTRILILDIELVSLAILQAFQLKSCVQIITNKPTQRLTNVQLVYILHKNQFLCVYALNGENMVVFNYFFHCRIQMFKYILLIILKHLLKLIFSVLVKYAALHI